jgi:hypothetical protein
VSYTGANQPSSLDQYSSETFTALSAVCARCLTAP